MSTIASFGALNIAGSVAGSQRSTAASDQAKAEAAEQAFQIDVARLSARANGDVSEADLSSDRDADGRMPYQEPDAEAKPQSFAEELQIETNRRSSDPAGILGNTLDIEA